MTDGRIYDVLFLCTGNSGAKHPTAYSGALPLSALGRRPLGGRSVSAAPGRWGVPSRRSISLSVIAISARMARLAAAAGVLARPRAHQPVVATARSRRFSMKLSARNQLKGRIVAVAKGQTTAHVRIDIGDGVIVTASITNEAVDDLALQSGDEAWAVIKASDVMVAK
jgi:molybdopterin-binding protein